MLAKSTLASLRLEAKKRFGQHFMTSETDLRFIADSLETKPGETVLEIGPGLGALTAFLLERGLHVHAVEKDRSLAAHLREQFRGQPLHVTESDILEYDLGSSGPNEKLAVFGNIPYNITSPILFWLVEQRARIKNAVLTVQLEVGQRLTGKPGHKNWGAVSVSLQAYADAFFLRKIPKNHFYPPPKVDSAVVRLDFLEKPRFDSERRELFHELVSHAFQKRRKTMLNALESETVGRTREALLRAFAEVGIDPKRRPETLAVSEWVLLARVLGK